jgi:WD40 repeat protein
MYVCVCSDEYVVATGSMDGTIRVWDCRKSGATAQLAVLDQYAGTGSSRRTAQSVNPQASFLSQPVVSHAGGVNGLLFLPTHKTTTTTSTTTIGGGTGRIYNSSTCNNIFSTGFDRHARLWEVTTHKNPSTSSMQADTEPDGGVTSATGMYIPTTFPTVRPSTRRCVFGCVTRLSHASNTQLVLYPCISTSARHTNMTSIAGAGGLAGAAEACVCICDVETGEVKGELVGLHSGPINAVRVRSQSQQVFTAGNDGFVLVWESGLVTTGRTREDAA